MSLATQQLFSCDIDVEINTDYLFEVYEDPFPSELEDEADDELVYDEGLDEEFRSLCYEFDEDLESDGHLDDEEDDEVTEDDLYYA